MKDRDLDLFMLVADKSMQFALEGILLRPKSLGIRAITFGITVVNGHDPTCARDGVDRLSSYSKRYSPKPLYGLLMFDYVGSGKEGRETQHCLQNRLNKELDSSAWGERAKAIVLNPELEVWVWGNSPHVEEIIGWKRRKPKLHDWLIEQGWLQKGETKPARPKEAFEAAVREAKCPRSAALYRKIAGAVSLRGCTDAAFVEFTGILRAWFSQKQA